MHEVVRRGDIFLADIGYDDNMVHGGIRPVIIIQNNIGNKYRPVVLASVITSRISLTKLPTHVFLPSGEYGLGYNSVILVDEIITINKSKLIKKINVVNKEILIKINEALAMSLDLEEYQDYSVQISEYIRQMNKPLILTEGKTDTFLIKTAWKKLYPNRDIIFECEPSGIQTNIEEREGNAESVRRTLEYMSTVEKRLVIGLFDNDREGNEKYKGLNSQIFEEFNISKDIRKHKVKNIWGMLLPVPHNRSLFVTSDDITQRYLVIEHYFSDSVLKKYQMNGKNILGTSVFSIKGNKRNFSKIVENLEPKEFVNFKILFDKIESII